MKLIFSILFLFVYSMETSQAKLSLAQIMELKTSFIGMPPGKFPQSVILQSEAEKLLGNPDLSEDLKLRVLDSMSNAEEGFNGCSTSNILPWMQIRCSAFQLARSKKELKVIENELIAKSSTDPNVAASLNAGV